MIDATPFVVWLVFVFFFTSRRLCEQGRHRFSAFPHSRSEISARENSASSGGDTTARTSHLLCSSTFTQKEKKKIFVGGCFFLHSLSLAKWFELRSPSVKSKCDAKRAGEDETRGVGGRERRKRRKGRKEGRKGAKPAVGGGANEETGWFCQTHSSESPAFSVITMTWAVLIWWVMRRWQEGGGDIIWTDASVIVSWSGRGGGRTDSRCIYRGRAQKSSRQPAHIGARLYVKTEAPWTETFRPPPGGRSHICTCGAVSCSQRQMWRLVFVPSNREKIHLWNTFHASFTPAWKLKLKKKKRRWLDEPSACQFEADQSDFFTPGGGHVVQVWSSWPHCS